MTLPNLADALDRKWLGGIEKPPILQAGATGLQEDQIFTWSEPDSACDSVLATRYSGGCQMYSLRQCKKKSTLPTSPDGVSKLIAPVCTPKTGFFPLQCGSAIFAQSSAIYHETREVEEKPRNTRTMRCTQNENIFRRYRIFPACHTSCN